MDAVSVFTYGVFLCLALSPRRFVKQSGSVFQPGMRFRSSPRICGYRHAQCVTWCDSSNCTANRRPFRATITVVLTTCDNRPPGRFALKSYVANIRVGAPCSFTRCCSKNSTLRRCPACEPSSVVCPPCRSWRRRTADIRTRRRINALASLMHPGKWTQPIRCVCRPGNS